MGQDGAIPRLGLRWGGGGGGVESFFRRGWELPRAFMIIKLSVHY